MEIDQDTVKGEIVFDELGYAIAAMWHPQGLKSVRGKIFFVPAYGPVSNLFDTRGQVLSWITGVYKDTTKKNPLVIEESLGIKRAK
ncbi:MAG TPA: hypothetical protein VNZ45_01130 [Bacteroidia bacterium]|jgi:hypothetical protein|nr:hypothetical protein [Bacteroidia bacterium]